MAEQKPGAASRASVQGGILHEASGLSRIDRERTGIDGTNACSARTGWRSSGTVIGPDGYRLFRKRRERDERSPHGRPPNPRQ